MRLPDWIVYVLALGVVLFTLFAAGTRGMDAPEPLPDHAERDGPTLPEPSIFDELVLVQVSEPQNGIGTAFAVNRNGDWLTARHVVDGCDRVSLLVGPGQYVPVQSVAVDEESDLALVRTGRSPRAVALDLDGPLRVGDYGYHVGYPQGRPGEAVGKLLARSRMVTRGERRNEEPVLAWAKLGRTRGLTGPLSGMSGGPVLDSEGRVRGVIVAESPRRGRIYTAAPANVAAFLEDEGVRPDPGRPEPIDARDYGRRADDLRNSLQVVKVACRVKE